MPVQRTKEQKMRAQVRREASMDQVQPVAYTFKAGSEVILTIDKAELLPETVTQYIKKDLFRTSFVSIILFATLVGIYIYLGYN